MKRIGNKPQLDLTEERVKELIKDPAKWKIKPGDKVGVVISTDKGVKAIECILLKFCIKGCYFIELNPSSNHPVYYFYGSIEKLINLETKITELWI